MFSQVSAASRNVSRPSRTKRHISSGSISHTSDLENVRPSVIDKYYILLTSHIGALCDSGNPRFDVVSTVNLNVNTIADFSHSLSTCTEEFQRFYREARFQYRRKHANRRESTEGEFDAVP